MAEQDERQPEGTPDQRTATCDVDELSCAMDVAATPGDTNRGPGVPAGRVRVTFDRTPSSSGVIAGS